MAHETNSQEKHSKSVGDGGLDPNAASAVGGNNTGGGPSQTDAEQEQRADAAKAWAHQIPGMALYCHTLSDPFCGVGFWAQVCHALGLTQEDTLNRTIGHPIEPVLARIRALRKLELPGEDGVQPVDRKAIAREIIDAIEFKVVWDSADTNVANVELRFDSKVLQRTTHRSPEAAHFHARTQLEQIVQVLHAWSDIGLGRNEAKHCLEAKPPELVTLREGETLVQPAELKTPPHFPSDAVAAKLREGWKSYAEFAANMLERERAHSNELGWQIIRAHAHVVWWRVFAFVALLGFAAAVLWAALTSGGGQ